jgi:hypothetical protein
MENEKKAAIGAMLLSLVLAADYGRHIYHERHLPMVMKAPEREVIPDDDLVFLKHKRPSSMADLKDIYGTTLWVSAGGQLEYYPLAGKTVQYGKSAGTLLGAQELKVKGAVEQVAPKNATFRIPGGDRQVLLVFTLPAGADPAKEYAVPVGYREKGEYTFYTDEIFFYDDPHVLYKHWGPAIWKAVDSHTVIMGMNERQVELSLGQVSKSGSKAYGNRMVVFDNMGHPMDVTFEKNHVTGIRQD